ncbi:MAG: EamA family transporter [Leucobacter sp.]
MRTVSVAGFLFAIASAASFAMAGIFASALMSAGWSAGAAAALRIVLAALILAAPTVIMLRGRWHLVRRAWRSILLFGLLAVVGAQLAFFLAVQFIAPSLALLIEFTGPVLLMLWTWARTRVAPAGVTLLGAAVAVLGLIAISGVATGGALHPLGILFALIAAVGVAAYYATGATSDHGIPPLPFVGLGLLVGAVLLILLTATGLLPFSVSDAPAVVAGVSVSPWALVAGMVLLSTVLAYVLGVGASRRLGATVASFTGYSEPLFGILWTALLLALLPTPQQWLGAALIVTGVVVVKVGELLRARRRRG